MISKEIAQEVLQSDDLYLEISIEFRSITIIFVWGECIIYLAGVLAWVK